MKGRIATLGGKRPRPIKAAVPAEKVNGSPQYLDAVIQPASRTRWMLPTAANLTPQYVQQLLTAGLWGDHAREWELFDLMLEYWPELSSVWQELCLGVVRKRLIFEPYREEDEDPTPSAIERCKLVSGAIRRMKPDLAGDECDLDGTVKTILGGLIQGQVVIETIWQQADNATWGPRGFAWVHPSNFGWENGRLWLRQTVKTGTNGSTRYTSSITDFPPNKFLLSISTPKPGPTMGGAMLRTLAAWFCAVQFGASWLMTHASLFGIPFRWANYKVNAPGVTKDAVIAMLQNMGSTGMAAFPEGVTMQFLNGGSNGGDHTPQGELVDRANRECRSLILGQTLTGSQDASKGGGKAFGGVEAGVKADRIDAAGKFATGVINGQLIPAILMLNYGDTEEAPTCRYLEEEEGDLADAQRDQILSTLMTGSIGQFRKKYDWQAPEDDDDSFGGPPPAPVAPVGKPALGPDGKPLPSTPGATKPESKPDDTAEPDPEDAKEPLESSDGFYTAPDGHVYHVGEGSDAQSKDGHEMRHQGNHTLEVWHDEEGLHSWRSKFTHPKTGESIWNEGQSTNRKEAFRQAEKSKAENEKAHDELMRREATPKRRVKARDSEAMLSRIMRIADDALFSKALADYSEAVKAGDAPGHEFHGNQWTGGEGHSFTDSDGHTTKVSADLKKVSIGMPGKEKIVPLGTKFDPPTKLFVDNLKKAGKDPEKFMLMRGDVSDYRSVNVSLVRKAAVPALQGALETRNQGSPNWKNVGHGHLASFTTEGGTHRVSGEAIVAEVPGSGWTHGARAIGGGHEQGYFGDKQNPPISATRAEAEAKAKSAAVAVAEASHAQAAQLHSTKGYGWGSDKPAPTKGKFKWNA